jgi:AcrR family transcriptional regulator
MSSSRDRILDAAAELIRTRGLARTTTKEIARAAGVAEGTIYKQFADKHELIGQVLYARLPSFIPAIKDLSARVGEGRVRDNLVRIAVLALDFYREAMPMSASLLADQDLLDAQRRANTAHHAGPQRAHEAVADYLAAEQRAGRIPPTARPRPLADLLLGACFQQSYLDAYAGADPTRTRQHRRATDLIDALAPIIEPDQPS